MKLPIFAAVVFLSAASAAGESLTLQRAVDLAIDNNPHFAMSIAARDAARATDSEARAAWLPEVTLTETFTRGDNPVFVFGSLLEQGRFDEQHFDPAFLNDPGTMENYRLALNVRLPLFDRLRRISNVRQTSLAVEQSDLEVEAAAQALRLEVVRRYLAVVVADASLVAADAAVAAAEANVNAVRERHESGLVVRSDLLSAEVQLAEMKQEQVRAAAEVVVARAALNQVSGRPTLAATEVTGDLESSTPELLPIEEVVADARHRRPELAQLALATDEARLGRTIARGAYLPRLDAFAAIASSGDSSSAGDGDDKTFGVVLSIDVLSPGRSARAARAKAALDAAVARRRAAETAIEGEVIRAYYGHRTARQRLEVARTSAEQAEAAERIVRDRYAEGLTTITDLLRTQATLLRARMNELTARSDSIATYAELLRATGRLNDVTNIF